MDASRQRKIKSHQHRWPNDGVEPQDFFANDMQVGGPKVPTRRMAFTACFRQTQGSGIVEERVDPNINHMLLVPRHRDTPREVGSTDRDVLEAFSDPTEHLVASSFWSNKVRLVGK